MRAYIYFFGIFLLAGAHSLSAEILYTVTALGMYASGINNKGQVVGYSGDHGFLYINGQMQDLGFLGPTAINDAGQITRLACTMLSCIRMVR